MSSSQGPSKGSVRGRRRGQQQEESNYVRYLKYKQAGFQLGKTDKTIVWVPNKERDNERAYVHAEVLRDDDKNFTYRTEDGEEKTLPKNEKTYMGVNPPKFDGVEDMAELGYLSEPAVLYNLKKRYEVDLFHTYSGLFLVVVNPYKRIPIYTEEMIDIYRGRPRDKVAPHIFAISDAAYRAMLQNQHNQSMLITGESGAGKTENTKKVIQYLATIAGRAGGGGTLEQQLLEFNPILEAFGNAKTTKNNNSSRFGKFIELQFNAGGQIAGANTLIYLLEKSRVVFQAQNERNFHIFYQILSDAMGKELKEQLHLTRAQDYAFLNQSGCYTINGVDDAKEFEHSISALNTLNVSEGERVDVYKTLSAVLHLGNLPFEDNQREVAALKDDNELNIAAQLLGVSPEKLRQGILAPRMLAGNEWVSKALNSQKASANRDALCKSLYGRLFVWIVRKINTVLSHPQNKAYFIGVLDISGFEIFQKNSFEQLCINFTNEKLQQFFNHHMFTLEQEEYEREKIDWSFVNFGLDLQDTIDLIEKKPMGILSVLDEQTVFPDADDTSLTKKLHDTHESHRSFRKPRFVANTFKIIHYAGEVEYATEGWLEKNRDPLENDLETLMKESNSAFVRDLFDEALMPSFAKVQQQQQAEAAGGPSSGGRRVGSGRRGKGGAQFITVSSQYKEQLSHLMDTLRATNPHFIRCILPNLQQRPGLVHDHVVLDQLKCNGVLEGIRITRKGFPNRLKYADFLKRYHLLKPGATATAGDVKAAAKDLIDYLASKEPKKVLPDQIRYGLTKIFFRTGQLAVIEEMRERFISEMITSIQAAARAFLARRLYDKMREQTVSAKILQRNIRAYLELQSWPWWELYVKARPRINQRNFQKEIEDLEKKIKELTKELEAANKEKQKLAEDRKLAEDECDHLSAEINSLKAKLLDLEGEKTDLEAEKELLQKKVAGLEEELQDETSASNDLVASSKKLEEAKRALEENLLEEERQRRELEQAKKKVETERDDFRAKYEEEAEEVRGLKAKREELERQLLEARDSAHDSESVSETLRAKLKSAEKSLGETKAQLGERDAQKAELEKTLKRLEGELADAQAALEEERRGKDSANGEARRLQKQIDDLRAELDGERSKKGQLEKSEKTLKARVRELEEQLEDEQEVRGNVERIKKGLEDRLEDAEEKAGDLEKAKADLTNQLKNAKADLEEANRRLADAEGNASRLAKDKKVLEDDVASLEKELEDERDKAKQDKSKLTKKIQELTQALEEAPAGDASSEDIKRLEEQIEDLKDELLEAEDAKAAAEKNSRTAALEVDDLKAQLEDAERKNQALQKENRKLATDLEAAKEALTVEEDARAALDSSTRGLRGEIESLRKQLNKEAAHRARVEDAKANLDRENKTLRALVEALERKNSVAQREARDLQNRYDDLRYLLDQEARSKERHQSGARDLKKLLFEREKQNADALSALMNSTDSERLLLENEIATLKERNNRLNDEVSRLRADFDAAFSRSTSSVDLKGSGSSPSSLAGSASTVPTKKPEQAPAQAAAQ